MRLVNKSFLLSNDKLGNLFELWVSGVSIINLAKKFDVHESTITWYISIFYLGVTGTMTMIIKKQSAMNEPERREAAA